MQNLNFKGYQWKEYSIDEYVELDIKEKEISILGPKFLSAEQKRAYHIPQNVSADVIVLKKIK